MRSDLLRLASIPLFIALFFVWVDCKAQSVIAKPVRIAVARITHDHVGWILRRNKADIEIAGIYEPNAELAERYSKKYGFSKDLIYNDLNKMLDAVKPDAVVAFGSIYEHLEVVEACAPRHIDVMVEKPLAASLKQALRMDSLASKYDIKLLTNFETSWYPTTIKAYNLINDSNYIGSIKKVVVHDGHQGPKEIGVSKDFFEWLTDPVQNGGGAIVDFGCYGANLMTYLMHGQTPVSVTAVTQHFKPAIYPHVDDEATIVLTYPDAQCIIQASWNWPFGRKDMEIYGNKGYIITVNSSVMRLRVQGDSIEHQSQVAEGDVAVYTDPFSYLADVVRNKIKVPENGLYSLQTNLTVVRILDAAIKSAKTGKTIYLKK
ncbi:MAG TPA: Gfo/Idh/MocA family oxidoreductase [Puia sp.]|nr:Gfo/Idh/MocA family oxidoreductase [Puia sp.]